MRMNPLVIRCLLFAVALAVGAVAQDVSRNRDRDRKAKGKCGAGAKCVPLDGKISLREPKAKDDGGNG